MIFAGADADISAWGRLLLAGLSQSEARRSLDWPMRRADTIDRRWQRYLRRLSTSPAARLTDRLKLDASRTAALHQFLDARSGRMLAYWEHLPNIQ